MKMKKPRGMGNEETARAFCKIAQFVMFDHLELTREQLKIFETQMLLWSDRVQSGDIQIEEIEQILSDEAGVE